MRALLYRNSSLHHIATNSQEVRIYIAEHQRSQRRNLHRAIGKRRVTRHQEEAMPNELKVDDRIYRGNDKNRIGAITYVFSNFIFVAITTASGTVHEKWPPSECHLAD